ncbi:hypothetical protein C0995_013446 [Termitomyces sp. Mi166|nr:hypothetical protein C0995_013446 [Termitomyces sp. Mi166\
MQEQDRDPPLQPPNTPLQQDEEPCNDEELGDGAGDPDDKAEDDKGNGEEEKRQSQRRPCMSTIYRPRTSKPTHGTSVLMITLLYIFVVTSTMRHAFCKFFILKPLLDQESPFLHTPEVPQLPEPVAQALPLPTSEPSVEPTIDVLLLLTPESSFIPPPGLFVIQRGKDDVSGSNFVTAQETNVAVDTDEPDYEDRTVSPSSSVPNAPELDMTYPIGSPLQALSSAPPTHGNLNRVLAPHPPELAHSSLSSSSRNSSNPAVFFAA